MPMRFDFLYGFTGRKVPNADRFVVTTTVEIFFRVMERKPPHPIIVPFKHEEAAAIQGVPQPDLFISWARK